MKKYCFIILILIGAIACNKNVSKDMSSDKSKSNEAIQMEKTAELIRARNAARHTEVLDPNDFPTPVIQTFEELEDWLEFNDNLVIAHFASGSSKPFFFIDEGLMQHLANHINESERLTYKLIGHTNNKGNAALNMELSVQRSRAVFEVLINRYGLKLSKLGAYGEGETNPLNDNSTLEMRKANSRVVLRKSN